MARAPLRCERLDDSPAEIIRHHLVDPRHGWSIGTYGALGEFTYDHDEPDLAVDLTALTVRSRRGALTIVSLEGVQPVALIDETGCTREIAFCTARTQAQRTLITSLGDNVFDVGVGAPHIDLLVRLAPGDAETAAALQASIGRSLFAAGTPAGAAIARSSPTRILASAIAKLEVHQRIPPPGGRSPDGPHTHLLPKLLARGLTRKPGRSLPDGLYCGLSLYPR